MKMATAKQLMIVPPGFRIKTAVIDGEAQSVLVAKTTRNGPKTPKKVRERIAASLRKIKIPILTGIAQLPWVLPTIGFGFNALTKRRWDDAIKAASSPLSAFTGVVMTPTSTTQPTFTISWQPQEMVRGIVPNGIVWLINKSGMFRGINQKLARTRLPIRLN